MDRHDLISVIMPVYNAEKYLRASIDSVLAQTYDNWELIAADDNSLDSSVAILKEYSAIDSRIRYICLGKNCGAAAARNAAVAQSRGRYIAFLDSDDLWHCDKLRRQMAYAENGADLIYCSYAVIDDAMIQQDIYNTPRQVTFQELLRENCIGCSTVMLSAAIARQYPFQCQYYHEDYLLWLQVLHAGFRAAGCDEVLTYWRYHRSSRSSDKIRCAYHRWKIYKHFGLCFRERACSFVCYCINGLRKYLRLNRRGVGK